MQIPGTAEKTMYGPYLEHRITGKPLQDLGCSEIVILKVQTFELHSLKSVTQIVDASEGLLSENEAYELKQTSRLARKCLKTFGKSMFTKDIRNFTIFHNPCLYQISAYKRKGQPAPILWQIGWLLARNPPSVIIKNGGTSVGLAQAKELAAVLKNREIEMQDVEKVKLSLNRSEIREINQLRVLFKLKAVEKETVKRIRCNHVKKEIEVV